MISNTAPAENAPLLVIGAGFGRTGTTSLKEALEILYQKPCYHMAAVVLKHRNHVKLWTQLYDLMEKDPNADLPEDVIREIFRGYQLTTDNPGCTIYKQLLKVYPDAKVILTIRDPNTWIQSVRETVRPKKPTFRSNWLGRLQERLLIAPGFGRMIDQTFQLCLGLNVDLSDDGQMIKGFIQWNEQVKRVVPADKLLVFQVKEGWGPLCQFLNKPIPQTPFPHVNDRAEMKKRLSQFHNRITLLGTMSLLVLGAAVIYGIWWFKS